MGCHAETRRARSQFDFIRVLSVFCPWRKKRKPRKNTDEARITQRGGAATKIHSVSIRAKCMCLPNPLFIILPLHHFARNSRSSLLQNHGWQNHRTQILRDLCSLYVKETITESVFSYVKETIKESIFCVHCFSELQVGGAVVAGRSCVPGSVEDRHRAGSSAAFDF